MNFKKPLLGLFILTLLAGTVSAKAKKSDKNSGKLKVVTTIFPEYDWVREIAGDKISDIDLTLLCDNGVDMHSFQPTAQDRSS